MTHVAAARQNLVPGSRFTSGRGAAMGDAFLPVGEDGASGLFYNPANLGKIRKTNFEFFNFTAYGNTGLVNMMNKDFYKVSSLPDYEPTLSRNRNTFASSGFSILPNFHTKYFAFGLLMQNQLGALEDSDGNIHYRSTYQLIPTIGTGVRLARGIVRLGYSLQYVNEASGRVTTSAASSNLGFSNNLKRGSGFSHNVGAALTFPWQYVPQFNLVLRNVGSLKYSGSAIMPLAKGEGGTLDNEPMTIDTSLSFQPKAGGGGFYNLVLQARDMTNTSKTTIMDRIAIGTEFSYRDVIMFRFGFSSWYPSAGIGLRRKSGELGLSWYSEELGATSRSQRDTRFLLHYSVGVF